MGRHLQESYQKPKQVILTLPLLEGLDGVEKMSKSKGNYISLEDTPTNMFGKFFRDYIAKYLSNSLLNSLKNLTVS